ncbi:MAG TPA: exo-alpha-sialidase [Bradyrhizobium sp.]|nr:exo-alpha-sialidase [Bradyrhizobium sp.]
MKAMMIKRGTRYAMFAALIIFLAGALYAYSAPSPERTTVAALSKETHFHGIAVDPADSARIYLATHHGLYAVGAAGEAQRISEVRDYMGFTAHPKEAPVLFASGHPASGGNLGFMVSKDAGRTWTKLSDGVGGPVDFHQMDVSKADPRVIYGVYGSLQRSADGGLTWQVVGKPPADIIDLAASSVDVNTIYAATQNGLQRSSDGGRTWNSLSDKPTIMVYASGDGILYAFMIGTGLVRAAEKSPVWQVVSKDFAAEYILHLAADPRDANRLFAIAYNSQTRTQSVLASRDGGAHWAPLGTE